MNIAERRFNQFINYINRYYELFLTENVRNRINYTAYKDIPKPIIQYAFDKYIALKTQPRNRRYLYKDTSKLTYFFTPKDFSVMSKSKRIYLKILQANYRD